MCSQELCASKTRSLGASNCLVITVSRSPRVSTLNSRSAAAISPLLPLHLFQIPAELVVPLFPELPVGLRPVGDVLDRLRAEPARAPLGVPAPGDQSGPFQHLQVLRDRGLAHRERLRQLRHGRLALRQPLEDRSARRIRERREPGVESLGGGCHPVPPSLWGTVRLYNVLVIYNDTEGTVKSFGSTVRLSRVRSRAGCF